MDHRIDRYDGRDRDQVLALQRHLWSEDMTRNDRYFHWKYERNPYAPDPLIVLAREGSRVVGMCGALGLPWSLHPDEPSGILYWADAVVAPPHRRRGIARRRAGALIDEARSAGAGSLVATSAAPIMRRIFVALGASPTREIHPLVRDGSGTDGGPTRDEMEELDHAARSRNTRGVRVTRAVQPDVMQALARSRDSRGRMHPRRDAGYFSWRYANPLCRYRFLFHPETPRDPLRGYLVVQAHGPEHDTRLNIVDWEAVSPPDLATLVGALIELAGDERLTTWGSGASAFDRVFLDSGFVPAPPPEPPRLAPALLVLPLDETVATRIAPADGRELERLENWDLRMIVSDFY